MTGPAAAGVATACAVAIHAVLLLLWLVRRQADRRAARRFSALTLDPYHVIVRAERWNGGVHRTAAATLLVAGLIEISPEGLVTVTEAGRDPARDPRHPIEAALLECLRADGAPVALSQIGAMDDMHRRYDAALREQDERMPRGARPATDGLGWMAPGPVPGTLRRAAAAPGPRGARRGRPRPAARRPLVPHAGGAGGGGPAAAGRLP